MVTDGIARRRGRFLPGKKGRHSRFFAIHVAAETAAKRPGMAKICQKQGDESFRSTSGPVVAPASLVHSRG